MSLKGVLVIIDGLGDLPNRLLGDKTPLEAASIPNINFFAMRGELGTLYPVRMNYAPSSDEGILSIFGNSLDSARRGQLEAIGAGIRISRGDLALRINFGTIDSLLRGNIIDRRARRTLSTNEAKELEKEINKIKLPCEFEFKATMQHRGVLVLKGDFSSKISSNDLTYGHGAIKSMNKIMNCAPLENSDKAKRTANIVNEFLKKSYDVLTSSEVNNERIGKGLLPANYIFLRGGGTEGLRLKKYSNWMALAYMPLEIGFGKASGMDVYGFEYPKLKNANVYENLFDGLEKACDMSVKAIKNFYKKYDFLYIHLKETDLPGHDNKPFEKKKMLEIIDSKLFSFLKDFAPQNKISILVTGDHSTPCALKNHSADPVPVLFYNCSSVVKKDNKFCERNCKGGGFGTLIGGEMLKKAGFV